MSYNKARCLKVLKYEKLIKKKFQTILKEYNLEKYFEFQN